MCHWRFFVTLTDWVTTGDPQSLSGDLFSGFWERYMTHQVICGDMKGFGSFGWKFESIHSSQFHLTACSMLLSERIFVALDPTTSHDIPRHPTTRRASWAGEASGFQFGTPSTAISRWLKHDQIASHKKHFLQQFWTLTTAGLSEMEIFKGHFQVYLNSHSRSRRRHAGSGLLHGERPGIWCSSRKSCNQCGMEY